MEFTIFQLITFFIIYSFLGWIMESTVRSICEKKIINTGFLIGPICPIYGIGAIMMLLFLKEFENKIIILFLSSLVVLTVWEYFVGVLLEKIFKTKYWDYSDHKFNYKGRICLSNTLCWGILGVIFVKFIHPFILMLQQEVDPILLKYIIFIVGIVFITDVIVSVVKIKNIKSKLEKIEQLNNEIKEKLKELRILNKEKSQEKINSKENIQKVVKQLKKKRDYMVIHMYKNVYRLKKAFPAINTKEISEILNKKIELIKRKRRYKKYKKSL